MRVERNISTVDTVDPVPTQVIQQPAAAVVPGETVIVPVDRYEQHVETVRVATETTMIPAAVTGGILSVLLLVFGGVALARAGVDGPWKDPVVTVGGFTATALLGIVALVEGFALLVASLARSRSAILLFSIIIGVMSVVAAIEPSMGHGSLAVERGFAVLVAIGAGIVVLSALLVPSVHRTASHVERV